MSLLRVQISRDGRKILEGDADAYTVVLHDTQTAADIIFLYGDGEHGEWIFLPGEGEPWRLKPISRSEE